MTVQVCLTFDFDALSLWLARGATTPGPLSRGEFAAEAVDRILGLLERRRVKATFFVPAHTVQTYPDSCRAIVDAGHEIGLHGDRHENVSTLDYREELGINEKSIALITQLTGTRPLGHRTPSFDFSPHTVPVLEEIGITYDSSLMGSDFFPYLLRGGGTDWIGSAYEFGEPTTVVELPVSWTLDDYPHLEFYRSVDWVMPGLQDPRGMFDVFFEDVRFAHEEFEDPVVTVTLHPEVVGRGARLRALDEFIVRTMDLGAEFRRCDAVALDRLHDLTAT
ncbi:polysaccharide deacetylase [Brevibacterium sp.]|uniref:polysaccharide deacetylase family protein n=1 Tax=Brevibacterium sp. TaxID=1701 RepID=UPI002810B9F3|nr:polysaccharide deacetylase [Brevibacterium sp.]